VIKDGIVVNPTTKESRRGNFARNNPTAAGGEDAKEGEGTAAKQTKKKDRQYQNRNETTKQLSTEQRILFEQLWSNIGVSLQQQDSWELFSSLLAIVQCWEGSKVRSSWIVDSSSRLDVLVKLEAIKMDVSHLLGKDDPGQAESQHKKKSSVHSVLSEAGVYCGSGDRHATLVKRILNRTIKEAPSDNYTRDKGTEIFLSAMEMDLLASFWNEAEVAISNRVTDQIFFALIKVVIISDGRGSNSWIHDLSKRLHSLLESNSLTVADDIISGVLRYCEASGNRHASLLMRVLKKSHESTYSDFASSSERRRTTPVKKNNHDIPYHYQTFIKHLQIVPASNGNKNMPTWDLLMNPYLPLKLENRHLSLPNAPIFVDSTHGLDRLEAKLREVTSRSDESKKDQTSQLFSQLVAFDSEFCTTEDGRTKVATIQFSVLEDGIPSAWVVDLIPAETRVEGSASLYYSTTCDLLRWLFLDSGFHILGFAPRHDLHLLSDYIGEEISVLSSPSKIYDVQLLAAYKMTDDMERGHNNGKKSVASLPGLKSCCSYFLSGVPWTLSKQEQCSNWQQRPLTVDQLEYAGLDAAVLLVLLSELVRRC
jgi:hypothetical protein